MIRLKHLCLFISLYCCFWFWRAQTKTRARKTPRSHPLQKAGGEAPGPRRLRGGPGPTIGARARAKYPGHFQTLHNISASCVHHWNHRWTDRLTRKSDKSSTFWKKPWKSRPTNFLKEDTGLSLRHSTLTCLNPGMRLKGGGLWGVCSRLLRCFHMFLMK